MHYIKNEILPKKLDLIFEKFQYLKYSREYNFDYTIYQSAKKLLQKKWQQEPEYKQACSEIVADWWLRLTKKWDVLELIDPALIVKRSELSKKHLKPTSRAVHIIRSLWGESSSRKVPKTITRNKSLTEEKLQTMAKYICFQLAQRSKFSFSELSTVFRADDQTISRWIQEIKTKTDDDPSLGEELACKFLGKDYRRSAGGPKDMDLYDYDKKSGGRVIQRERSVEDVNNQEGYSQRKEGEYGDFRDEIEW